MLNFNMKLLNSSPSFSSCSSSSSSTAFDATMCNSKSATAGCLAGIFRRILCYGSFPTYPSDHITEQEEEAISVESCKDQDFKSKEKTEANVTPSIVARLMGLDSVPDINLVTIQSTPSSISRSKSMNSVDRFAGGDDPMQTKHRRVKSTQSFREMPTFLELENEEFFVLSFESESKSKEIKSKGRKGEKGCVEVKQKRSGKSKSNENGIKREAEKKKKQGEEGKRRRVLKDLNGREMMRSRRRSRVENIKKETICDVLKNVESECSSEDLSPVSVLDSSHQFLADPQLHQSDEEEAGLLSPRRTSTREGKCLGSRKKEYQSAKYIEIWGEVCRLAEDDLVGSNWIIHNKGMWSHEGCASAGISVDLGSEILGQLLDELVDQFADFSMKIQIL